MNNTVKIGKIIQMSVNRTGSIFDFGLIALDENGQIWFRRAHCGDKLMSQDRDTPWENITEPRQWGTQ